MDNPRRCETLGDQEQIKVFELKSQPDHSHLILPIPPKYGEMGCLKGKLALRLLRCYEQLGKRYWGHPLWSRGDCVSTIGLDEDKIRKDVKWQGAQDKQAEQTQQRLFD